MERGGVGQGQGREWGQRVRVFVSIHQEPRGQKLDRACGADLVAVT